ncbi:hypothetical protein [Streptacidiphilus sp. PAMC 29251]
MTHSQLIEAALALVVLVAGAFGYGRRRGGGSGGSGGRSGRGSGTDRPRPRPRIPRPGPRAGRPPAAPSRSSKRAPSRLPEPREIWWAEVPFEDGPGSKDRPCLVLHRGATTATVLKITSKHHTERPGVLSLPRVRSATASTAPAGWRPTRPARSRWPTSAAASARWTAGSGAGSRKPWPDRRAGRLSRRAGSRR